ncbi:MAG: hypothetical protein L6R37_003877 [Teloschistes peruensis]|nr:MAG: hypothetical protein L6R37_003877 [Teloschistes peruensis]
MLAGRDQENLVHGHQAAAAAKPLNKGVKQLPLKTPGNKPAKTPIRIPLNDENGGTVFGGGKKVAGKGNENTIFGASKGGGLESKAFVTPMGPRNRAPLGMKTTNAKTKAFQTPAPASIDGDQGKINQKSASTRKPKPKISHPETTKLEDILADKDALDQREIEYMPPKTKDLPDYPDDHYALDLSGIQGPHKLAGWMDHYKDAEGLTYVERKATEEKRLEEWLDKKNFADIQLADDSRPTSCFCEPECWGDECKESIARRKEAQETYNKTIAEIEAYPPGNHQKPSEAKAPSTATSKAAAAALSTTKRSVPTSKAAAKPSVLAKKATSNLSNSKKIALPTNASEKRHAGAVAASKSTMGYSKGRSASAAMRKPALPGKENNVPEVRPNYNLAPALFIQQYGVPRYGSHKWLECEIAGCFDENKEARASKATQDDDDLGEAVKADDDGMADWFREEAEKDFVLEF